MILVSITLNESHNDLQHKIIQAKIDEPNHLAFFFAHFDLCIFLLVVFISSQSFSYWLP